MNNKNKILIAAVLLIVIGGAIFAYSDGRNDRQVTVEPVEKQ